MPVLVARAWSPGPEVFHQRDFDAWMELGFYCWILRRGPRTVLVDTGVPASMDAVNAGIRARKGPRSGLRPVVGDLGTALTAAGTRPDTIHAVILTSLGVYAAGNVGLFPRSRIFVSDRGWREYLHPRYPEMHHPLPAQVERSLRGCRLARVRGSAAPFPGLHIREVGAHHTASMAVTVATSGGVIGIADPIFVRDNLTRGLPIGVAEDLRAYWRLVRWLRRACDGVIPIHDLDPTPVSMRAT
jgi:hypothetical protein